MVQAFRRTVYRQKAKNEGGERREMKKWVRLKRVNQAPNKTTEKRGTALMIWSLAFNTVTELFGLFPFIFLVVSVLRRTLAGKAKRMLG